MTTARDMQPWRPVMEVTKLALMQNDGALVWGVDVATCLHEAGVGLPSVELAQVLLQHLRVSAGNAAMWSYIHHAMSSQMVSCLHMLALLTQRIIPERHQQPEMYTMYLELSSTFIFSLASTKSMPCRDRIVKAVDEALQLSQSSGASITEVGTVIVHFLFAVVARLADAVSEDWGMRTDKLGKVSMHGQVVSLADGHEDSKEKKLEQFKKNNSLTALHLMAKIMQNKCLAGILRLARRNLPEQWGKFAQKLHLLEALTRDPLSMAPKEAPETLGHLAAAIQQGLRQEWWPTQLPVIRSLLSTSSRTSSFGNGSGLGRSAPWLPFDIYMESVMERRRLSVTSNADTLADVMKALQSVHIANWVDVFLGLWTAALRLVYRDRESTEGPVPHVESRLCLLLSIVPIAISIVINEEEKGQARPESTSGDEKKGSRRAALESCLQVLGQFESLLVPPPVAVVTINQVVVKAAAYVNSGGGSMSGDGGTPGRVAAGNMRHLIVEACIARGLLDRSAYFWLAGSGTVANLQIPSSPSQPSPWSAFMEGAPLTSSLRSALMLQPAGSQAELDKIYTTAVSGPEEERAAAATVLCGASLTRSWNVQELAVQYAVRLLSPPGVAEHRGGNAFLAHGPMLHAALTGMSSVDAINVLSLFGMFPEMAASLLPICEFFGSLTNAKPISPPNSGEELSAHMMFSVAFLQLVKLWKFHRPPLEHCLLGSGAGLGADLSLEYLLQLRNLQLSSQSSEKSGKDGLPDQMQQSKRMQANGTAYSSSPTKNSLVVLDSFPKLKAWYLQHQACIASTLSGLVRNNPVHQIADRLLSMMFKKLNKSATAPTTGSSGNTAGPLDDVSGRPILTAWEIIAAVPFVIEAALTACAQNRLSPRDMTTGLRDLVDYLPGTIATIVSYCSAEVSRGFWKYASMNGQDWPSPAANLLTIQGEVKDILAATGVHIPNPTGAEGGNAPVSLPLPVATLIGLTITFKLEKASDLVLSVAGPGLESCSGGGPFSMQVVAALWAQKVRRWHDYIVHSAAYAAFKQNKEATLQLLRSCFAVTLSTPSALTNKLQLNGGVGALLGHGQHFAHGPETIAPGMMYLRSFPLLHDIMFLSDETLVLVADAAKDLGAQGDLDSDSTGPLPGNGGRLRCVQPSLATCMSRAVQATSLGASLLYVSGGTTLVAKLFTQSLPTWFLSGSGSKSTQASGNMVLEGFVIAHFAVLSGALAWGVSASKGIQASPGMAPLNMRRHYVLGLHMNFLASGMGGEISVACEHTIWRSYVVGFIALMVTCTPVWILDLEVETLRKLATGLRFWHERDLAAALLERGGPSALGATAELTLG